MITKKTITELATKHQTSEQNVAREYCQHLFLSYFYKKDGSEKILFKGGTALRIIFNSPRFSEDLDFSALDENPATISDINNLIDEVLKNIKKEGIECEKKLNPGTQGETTGGYFAVITFKLLEFSSEIKIQISFRSPEKIKGNSSLIANDFIASYVINHLAEDILVEEKINALLFRKKSRDLFDLYFILRNRNLVKYIPQKPELKEKLVHSVKEIKNPGELKLLLPVSDRFILTDFEERVIKEINTYF